ncbi:hypothetical protein Goarm_020439, partial [Gossypium armourianum]|nr:hypothetical protein [Gossypium armourianum]
PSLHKRDETNDPRLLPSLSILQRFKSFNLYSYKSQQPFTSTTTTTEILDFGVDFHISFQQQTSETETTPEPVPTHLDRSLSVLQRLKFVTFLGSQITMSISSRIDILWGYLDLETDLLEELRRGLDVNCLPLVVMADETEEKATVSSPNSALLMDFEIRNEMGQRTNELRSRPQGALPCDTENLRNVSKEHCKVVTLRSGKTLESKEFEAENEPYVIQNREKIQLNDEIPALQKFALATSVEIVSQQSSPEKSTSKTKKQEVQFKKFLDVLKQLHINIPLVEALEQ